MSKFKSRVDKLHAKTYGFVTYQTLCITRDYFKALFDEQDKPENFDEKFEEYSALIDEYIKTKDATVMAKADAIISTITGLAIKRMYQLTLELCDKYPEGVWMYNDDSDFYAREAKTAKRYFKLKRTEQRIIPFD